MKVLSLGHVAGAGWFSPTQMDSFYLVNYLRGPVYLFIHLFAFINVASFWHKTFFFFKKKRFKDTEIKGTSMKCFEYLNLIGNVSSDSFAAAATMDNMKKCRYQFR